MIVLYAVLVVVGVTLLAITGVRLLAGGVQGSSRRKTAARLPSQGSARQILEERYAAGELSSDEFEQRLRLLEGRNR